MKKLGIISGLIVILFPLIPSGKCLAQMKAQQGVLLEQGIGVREKLEIGSMPSPKVKDDKKLRDELGLDFNFGKAEGKEKIWNIKCEKAGCVTDKNVGVGDPQDTVYLRYGSPSYEKKITEKKTKSKAGEKVEGNDMKFKYLLVYDGIAFEIKNEKVSVIYILPPTTKK